MVRVEIVLLAGVIIAGLLVVRQLHRPAVTPNSAVHGLNTPLVLPPTQSESSVNEDSFNSSDSAGGSNTSSSHTSLSVNGQDIPLPANGSINRTTTDGNTTTTVNAQTSSSDGQSGSSHSTSVNVDVNSHTEDSQ